MAADRVSGTRRRRRLSDRREGAACTDATVVLFVDDDESVGRAFARAMSRRDGCEVVLTTTPQEAIQIAQRRRLSAVVTDLRMPGMSGIELVEKLRAVQPSLAFVVVSGVPDLDALIRHKVNASIVGVLPKPWNQAELLESVDRAIELVKERRRDSSAPVDSRALVVGQLGDLDPMCVPLLKRMGWSPEQVHSLAKAEARLRRRSYDLIVTDLELPDSDGLATLSQLQRVAPSSTLVVYSDRYTDSMARQVIRLGAHDFLSRGARPEELRRSFVLAVERSRVTRRLERLAEIDQLTGLGNRSALRERFTDAVQHAAVNGLVTGMLYVDLDRFKRINESIGHEAGDAILQIIGQRLEEVIREDDFVARLAGDEFAVVLTEIRGLSDAEAVANRVIRALQEPVELPEVTMVITASVGVAVTDGEHPMSLDELLRAADAAMFSAKQSGRNRAQGSFEATTASRGLARLEMENELRDAVRNRRLNLAYQPQVDAATLKLRGFEALLRWTREDGSTVSPAFFVPMLEDLGLVDEAGEQVIRTALAALRRWRDQGLNDDVRMGINLSPNQFEQAGLVSTVQSALDEHGLDPELCELEITEGVLMRDTARTNETLRRLKALGVRIGIDDFGTGYCSLAYLKRFGVDTLKIDRCFIKGLTHDGDAPIVGAVINIGHRLGIEVLAEGVETQEQLDVLRREGCDLIQGYLTGKPSEGWTLADEMLRCG